MSDVGPKRRRILLVEDEPAVRELARRLLERLGHELLVARDAAEALRIAAAEPERTIDLLISDVVMPGLSGPELARVLEACRPGLRTLFISGFARDTAALAEILDSGARLLSKPFGQAELAHALREVLGA